MRVSRVYPRPTPPVDIAVRGFEDSCMVAAEGGGADLVLTSPPYEDARTYGADVCWTFPDYQRLGDAIFCALRPGGHAIVVLDGPVRSWREGFGTERSFTPWRVMLDWAERVGFRVPDRLAYARIGAAGEFRGRFRNNWEPMFWFQRAGGDVFLDKRAIARPAKCRSRSFVTSRLPDGTMFRRRRRRSGYAVDHNLVMPSTLWSYGSVGVTGCAHPATFSQNLAQDVVRCFCPPGGLVCDPMVGSGTAALAAVRCGCRFVGGDLFSDAHGKPWADVALERVRRECSRSLLWRADHD